MEQTDDSLKTWLVPDPFIQIPAWISHSPSKSKYTVFPPSQFLRNVPMQLVAPDDPAPSAPTPGTSLLSPLLALVFVGGLACSCVCLDVSECKCACVYPCAESWSWHWVSLSVAFCFLHWRSLAEPGPHQIWLFLESQLARKSPGSATWAWWLQMSANLPGFHVGTGDPKFCLYSFKSSPLSLKSPLPAPCLSQFPNPRNFYSKILLGLTTKNIFNNFFLSSPPLTFQS